MYYDIGAYDMKYDEFKEMVRKTWSEKINYVLIRLKTKMKVYVVFSMKIKTEKLNVLAKVKLFSFLIVVSN